MQKGSLSLSHQTAAVGNNVCGEAHELPIDKMFKILAGVLTIFRKTWGLHLVKGQLHTKASTTSFARGKYHLCWGER